MRYPFILLFLLCCYTNSFAQRKDIPFTAPCGLEKFCKNCYDVPASFKGSLVKYFSKQINWRILDEMGGVIIADIAIDSNGKRCAKTYTNYTTLKNSMIHDLGLNYLINTMPDWIPATKDGKPVNSTVSIVFFSNVVGHERFDVTYFDPAILQKPLQVKTPQNTNLLLDWEDLGKKYD